MRKILKNALVITLVAGLCLSVVGIVSADPTYEDITVDPAEPERQSDVTFSVEITGDDYIEEVYLRIQECTVMENGAEACSPTVLNESMTSSDNITWTCTATLNWISTTIGHCWLVVKDNGTWYDYASNKLNKLTDFTVVPAEDGEDGNGDDGGDDTGDTGGTPGFELILVMISLVVALSIYKRKR